VLLHPAFATPALPAKEFPPGSRMSLLGLLHWASAYATHLENELKKVDFVIPTFPTRGIKPVERKLCRPRRVLVGCDVCAENAYGSSCCVRILHPCPAIAGSMETKIPRTLDSKRLFPVGWPGFAGPSSKSRANSVRLSFMFCSYGSISMEKLRPSQRESVGQ
jgi:hypothetical protein